MRKGVCTRQRVCACTQVTVWRMCKYCVCMLGRTCVCMRSCVRVKRSTGLWEGLKWIPSRRLFSVPPAWPTMPLCSWLMALWDSCYPRGEGWSPPTFSFRAEMVNSCYLVSLCSSWALGSSLLSSWECERYVPLACLFAPYWSYLWMYQKVHIFDFLILLKYSQFVWYWWWRLCIFFLNVFLNVQFQRNCY